MHDQREQRVKALGFDYGAQPIVEVDRCNLCGWQRSVVLAHRDRYGYPARAAGCLRCGLVFLDPRMTADAYAAFYDGVYRPLVSAYHGRRIDAETIRDEQRSYAHDRAAFLDRFVRDESRPLRTMLDIGGSTGVVAAHLVDRFGVQATVLDPAPAELEAASDLGLDTVTGFVEDYDPGDRRFDLVVLCQTVDHLLDISDTLASIRGFIAERGLLFVDIVDFRAAYLRNWSVEAAIKIDHPYYLTEQTMALYLRRAGFEILGMEYATDHLHVGYVCGLSDAQPEALPAVETVAGAWREIRHVQNAPRS